MVGSLDGVNRTWPEWLAERGVMPGQRTRVGGLSLEPSGPIVQQGGVVSYKITENDLRKKVWEQYGPPVKKRDNKRRDNTEKAALLPLEAREEDHAADPLGEALGLVGSLDEIEGLTDDADVENSFDIEV